MTSDPLMNNKVISLLFLLFSLLKKKRSDRDKIFFRNSLAWLKLDERDMMRHGLEDTSVDQVGITRFI